MRRSELGFQKVDKQGSCLPRAALAIALSIAFPSGVFAAPPVADPVLTSSRGNPAGPANPGVDWTWRQTLSSTRIGGRLTTVAVDPTEPERIYVGTEEGTLLRSTDSGITWDEAVLTPYVVPRVGVASPRLGRPFVDPSIPTPSAILPDVFSPYRRSPLVQPGETSPLEITGRTPAGDVSLGAIGIAPVESLLSRAASRNGRGLVPVVHVTVCPGGLHGLFVATERELLASDDSGDTWLRVFALSGRERLQQVACAPGDPNTLALLSDVGAYVSTDGGLTFDLLAAGAPEQHATAATFAPRALGSTTDLYVASGRDLWVGDPHDPDRFEQRFPAGASASTGQASPIRWMAAAPSGAIWLAGDSGVRLSLDRGQTWEAVDRPQLEGRVFSQIVVGPAPGGGERAVVVSDDLVLASDDMGKTWLPFFNAISRRSFRQVATVPVPTGAPTYWVVTRGELWTTAPMPVISDSQFTPRLWAKRRLSDMPSLRAVIERGLFKQELAPVQVRGVLGSLRNRGYMPRIDARFQAGPLAGRRFLDTRLTGPFGQDERTQTNAFQVYVFATWSLPEAVFPSASGSFPAGSLAHVEAAAYRLRQRTSFVLEDVWHERLLQLQRVAGAEVSSDVIPMVLARIEALDAIVEQLTGLAAAVP